MAWLGMTTVFISGPGRMGALWGAGARGGGQGGANVDARAGWCDVDCAPLGGIRVVSRAM